MNKTRIMAFALSVSVMASGAAPAGAADPAATTEKAPQTIQNGKKQHGTAKGKSALGERSKRSDVMKRATDMRKRLSSAAGAPSGN